MSAENKCTARPALLIGVTSMIALAAVALLWLRVGPRMPAPASTVSPGDESASAAIQQTQQPSPVPLQNGSAAGLLASGRADAPQTLTNWLSAAQIEKLIQAARHASLPLAERRKAMKELALLGTDQALAVLKDLLVGGSAELRGAVAEALARCPHPEAVGVLVGLLTDGSEAVVKAAVRSLGTQGTPTAAEALNRMLSDPLRSSELRAEAAYALGDINQPGVFEALKQAAYYISDEEIVAQVLNGIAKRPLSETEAFFRSYLAGPNRDSELRVAAIEAVADSPGDPSGFLTPYVADTDSEVRSAAASALGLTDEPGASAAQLLSYLQAEPEADVRADIYDALANQRDVNLSAVLAAVQHERDASARIAGMDLLAGALRDSAAADLQTFFQHSGYQELMNYALNSRSEEARMRAVIALRRANTLEAIRTLREIAGRTTDPNLKESLSRLPAP